MSLTFGSLFAGIGGLDLGLERAGMTCRWQVEIDDYCQRVLAKHWPSVRRHDDITAFPPTHPDEWRVDLIAAGFPCQDISYAGKGAGLNGTRSGLFFEAIRVVRLLEPRYVLLENVAALLTRGLDTVLGTLASIGFDARWDCIPAGYFGTHFVGDRIYVIATPSKATGLRFERRWPACTSFSNNEFERLVQHQLRHAVPTCRHRRLSDGISNRIQRLRGLGNAVVPQVAEYLGMQILQTHS